MRVFVTTQMRTGSTWLCDILSTMLGRKWEFWSKGHNIPPKRFKKKINAPSNKNEIIKLHWCHPKRICEQIPNGNKDNYVISVTRDVRDLAISMIMYIRYDSIVKNLPRLKKFMNARTEFGNRKLPDKDYINGFIKIPPFKTHVIDHWKRYNDGYEHPNYLLISYEELNRNPLKVVKRISELLGYNFRDNRLNHIVAENTFKKKTKRNPGTGDNRGFRRKGVVGDWKNYLTPESIKNINLIMGGESIPKGPDKIFILGGRSGTTLLTKCIEQTGKFRLWKNPKHLKQPEPKQILPQLYSKYPSVPDNLFPLPSTFDVSKLPEFDLVIPQLIRLYDNPKFIVCERPIEEIIASHLRTGWHKISFKKLQRHRGLWSALGNPRNARQLSVRWFNLKVKLRRIALKNYDQSKILRVQFDDLMYDFDNTMTKVAKFIDTEPTLEQWNKLKKPRTKEVKEPETNEGVTYVYPTINMIKQRGEQWVRDSFESLKGQSDDIIVVDYSSSDNIEEIAKEYGFRFFNIEKTPGFYFHMSKMFNKAVIESKYDYFVRVTPDCVYPKGLTKRILKFYKGRDPNKFILCFEYTNTVPITRKRRGRSLAYYKPLLIKARGWDERTSYFMKEHVYGQQLMYKVFKLKLQNSSIKLLHREHPKKTTDVKVQNEIFPPDLVKQANRVFKNFLPKLATNIDRYVVNVQNSYW
ncbi:MAG: sulfotransferase domain-containing protein [Saprospiraceae bacterium]